MSTLVTTKKEVRFTRQRGKDTPLSSDYFWNTERRRITRAIRVQPPLVKRREPNFTAARVPLLFRWITLRYSVSRNSRARRSRALCESVTESRSRSKSFGSLWQECDQSCREKRPRHRCQVTGGTLGE